MEEAGLDMSWHTSKTLQSYLGKMHFGYLITVCSRAEEQCPIFPGMGVRLHWPFEDPAVDVGDSQAQVQRFRRVRDEIEARVLAWLGELSAEA